ncbi:LysR substrate-binding domain-containing protein [Pseudooceanicola sp. MF1-13]|uniref:LysR substrate-binding domain-containing protein n=1 Tax=Pseudooceanicola sp. MF1-13 TaxID=3379095 RepID=UPI00389194E9
MTDLRNAPLNGLRAAEAVYRTGSLSAAGKELGVSPGAVSQQVARLEDALDLALFDRRPTGMIPAEGTAEVFRLLSQGFDQIAAAIDLTRRDKQSTLTISVAPIFAARWLIWRLPDFSKAHPDIRVRFDSDVTLVDPNTGAADFTIRIGRGPYPNVTAQPLFPQRVVPVCHADLAAKLTTPQDLRHVPIIRESHGMYDWRAWLTPDDPAPDELPGGPVFNEGSLCLDAAMTGSGVFLAFETLCSDALRRGQITAPFPRWTETGQTYWLVSARDRSFTIPQKKFRNWLMRAIEAEGLGTAELS